MRFIQGIALLMMLVTAAVEAHAMSPDMEVLCGAMARHVDASGGPDKAAPVFIRSYEPGPNETALPPPLATSAFSYDNALAIMALVSCGDTLRARRIGDAFIAAVDHDRTYHDGRVRNAYRAGPVKQGAVLLPGWWDAARNRWDEDAYQDGSQTGNTAWVALALLALDATEAPPAGPADPYLTTAKRLAKWIVTETSDPDGLGGFTGGYDGFDGQQTKLSWRSTEHNVDVHALGTLLSRAGDREGGELARSARHFLEAMYDEQTGHFRLGTKPDGSPQPPDKLALDALIWPLAGVSDPPSSWRRSLIFAATHLSTHKGFDFDGERHNLWTEGTAQAALVYRTVGDGASAKVLVKTAMEQISPSGYLFATDKATISTGLRVGPQSTEDDFFYYHRPHLGATAWTILAATGFNPFTHERIP